MNPEEEELNSLRGRLEWRQERYPISEYQRLVQENQALRAELLEILDLDGEMWVGIRHDKLRNRVFFRLGLWLLARSRE